MSITMNQAVIDQLGGILIEKLEADIVAIIGEKLDIPVDEALGRYYGSALARLIEEGAYGVQHLPAPYLADELLKELGMAGSGD